MNVVMGHRTSPCPLKFLRHYEGRTTGLDPVHLRAPMADGDMAPLVIAARSRSAHGPAASTADGFRPDLLGYLQHLIPEGCRDFAEIPRLQIRGSQIGIWPAMWHAYLNPGGIHIASHEGGCLRLAGQGPWGLRGLTGAQMTSAGTCGECAGAETLGSVWGTPSAPSWQPPRAAVPQLGPDHCPDGWHGCQRWVVVSRLLSSD
ncbi:hypothetical protein NDU88_007783 [Pleurodeles waltl]|uniref:Uncharacterized protein n=1 Tax=Pleurodeles waltl TaxID=8319 RepID=A0AAV7PMF1_PLEWA|nr:hypothetical protein NDU88_007783 [Pleurodeles waltl]